MFLFSRGKPPQIVCHHSDYWRNLVDSFSYCEMILLLPDFWKSSNNIRLGVVTTNADYITCFFGYGIRFSIVLWYTYLTYSCIQITIQVREMRYTASIVGFPKNVIFKLKKKNVSFQPLFSFCILVYCSKLTYSFY